MKKIHIKRLEQVVEAVEATPAKNLDMRFWDCGTVCCAVGAYCRAHPYARLKMKSDEYRRLKWPVYGGERSTGNSFSDVAPHFGLTAEEATHLFNSRAYTEVFQEMPKGVIKRAVIKRLKNFIREKAKAAS